MEGRTLLTNANYAVLFSGGVDRDNNHSYYYETLKYAYDVIRNIKKSDQSDAIPATNIYVLYADGTDPATDKYDDSTQTYVNSDMTFATSAGSTVSSATQSNLQSRLVSLASAIDSTDRFFFWSFDHGGDTAGNSTTDHAGEVLYGWGANEIINDDELQPWLDNINAAGVTTVHGQCFGGGMLEELRTGTGRFGCAATNHYEYSYGYDFAAYFAEALEFGSLSTHTAYNYAVAHDQYVDPNPYAPNEGTYTANIEHPWMIGDDFPVFYNPGVRLRGNSPGTLWIEGTDAGDTISVYPSGSYICISLNGTLYSATASSVASIYIYGQGGNDSINCANMTRPVRINGGPGNDSLTGGSGNDTLDGGQGNDFVDGGAGSDTFDGSSRTAAINLTLAMGDSTPDNDNDGYVGENTNDYVNIETVIGGSGNDTLDANEVSTATSLSGGLGNDLLKGGSGDDSLNGGSGDDTLRGSAGSDFVNGGEGTDMFSSWGSPYAIYFTLAVVDGANNDNDGFGTYADDYINIEEVMGTHDNDYIDARVMTVPVFIEGLAGNDTIYGGSNDDTIDGAAGDDYVDGGAGDDSIGEVSGSNTLIGNEGDDDIGGGDGPDTIYGNYGNDIVSGMGGDDYVDGGPGTDWFSWQFYASPLRLTITLSNGPDNDDDGDGSTGNDYIRIESVTGGDGNDYIDASAMTVAVTLIGEGGNDTLIGGSLADQLWGQSGDDLLRGNGGNDWIYGGNGNDLCYGDGDDDWMSGGWGLDTLWGGNGNDSLHGDGNSDTLYGESGTDTLDGQGDSAIDLLDGGLDSDTGIWDANDIRVSIP